MFDEISLSEAVDTVKKSVFNKQDCFISTPNLNFIVNADSNDAVFNSVIASDLSVADGMPIIWVAKLLGIPIHERVAGSTLFEQLINQRNDAEKIKVFFFGGLPGVAKQAHEKLNAKDSFLVSCGHYDPSFVDVDLMSKQAILNYINNANPDFIVVALGAEKGQKWILKNKQKLNAPVISHLGAVINFIAGTVTRAPTFWQKTGLEWLWRIKQEPVLWRRYFVDGFQFFKLMLFYVLPLAFYDKYLKFKAKRLNYFEIQSPNPAEYQLNGRFSVEFIDNFNNAVKHKAANECIMLDFAKLHYIDAAAIAQLLLFQHGLNKQGKKLYLRAVSKSLKRVLFFNLVKKRFNFI